MSVIISVVVPTYRRPELLNNCIRRLLEQRFDASAYEIIIVSDGPDPLTEKVIREFNQDDRLRYLSLPKKAGPAAARNLGWTAARGNLIAFTDDDTQPCRDWLSAFYQAWQNEEVIAFSGRTKVPLPHFPTDYEKYMASMQSAEFVAANCCCTKAALEMAGGFDERFTMAWGEDSDLQFKLLQQNVPIKKVREALVIHPVLPVPWGISIFEQKRSMYNALLYKKYPELYRRKIEPHPRWEYHMMVLSFSLMIIGIATQGFILAAVSFVLWTSFLALQVHQRLKQTTHAPTHVAEVVLTSMAIPFFSLFWKMYGALKYRTLFI